jgi:hypothetical protein
MSQNAVRELAQETQAWDRAHGAYRVPHGRKQRFQDYLTTHFAFFPQGDQATQGYEAYYETDNEQEIETA